MQLLVVKTFLNLPMNANELFRLSKFFINLNDGEGFKTFVPFKKCPIHHFGYSTNNKDFQSSQMKPLVQRTWNQFTQGAKNIAENIKPKKVTVIS